MTKSGKSEPKDLDNEEIEFIEESLARHVNETLTKIQETNKKTISKPKMFDHDMYNGKADKVALHQHLTNEWNTYNMLTNNKSKTKIAYTTHTTSSQLLTDEEKKPSKVDIIVTQKVRNIRRPLSFYKKF